MTDNLAEMIKNMDDDTIVVDTQENPALPEGAVSETENVINPENVPDVTPKLSTISLVDWFELNRDQIGTLNVFYTRLTIRGINPRDTMAFSFPVNPDDVNDETRDLFIFKETSSRKVINLPVEKMNIFNHDIFRIIYRAPAPYNNIFIKSYGVKTGLINVFCIEDSLGNLIPYEKTKMKKSDDTLELILPDAQKILDQLSLPANIEPAQILYKQLQKYVSKITTNQDLVTWFNEREVGVIDINHLLLIDDTLIYVFNQ